MQDWVFGVDASFDELSYAEAVALKNVGVKVFAQCLWTGNRQPPTRIINLRNAMQAGIPRLVGYISVSTGMAGNAHVDAGHEGVPQDIWDALFKVPIDVELPDLNYTTHVLTAWSRIVHWRKPEDAYTNYNTWVNVLGNPTRPQGVGLWNAYWDEHPDFDFPALPFGGWNPLEVWGEQWSGDFNHGGFEVDRNQFDAVAFELVAPPPVEPPPTSAVPTDAATAALATVAHFTRMSWNLQDLSGPDKQHLENAYFWSIGRKG